MPDEQKQKTEPKGIDPKTGKPYEPIEIPTPTREDVEALIDRAAQPARSRDRAAE